MRVWSIGEVLWDIFPSGEKFGGAALNFSANLSRLGNNVLLLSAVGCDERGDLALKRMMDLGLDTSAIQRIPDLPTGTANVEQLERGEPRFLLPRPAAYDAFDGERMALTSAALVNIDWVYCGTLMQLAPRVESFTKELLLRAPAVRLFYDMNLREGHWNLALVQRLSSLASVLKLNETEAHTLWRMTGKSLVPFDLEVFCAEWSMQHGIEVICITLGAEGCFVYHQGESYFLRGLAIQVQDTVGSGDAFAAGFLHQYHSGMPLREAAKFANALGALVATHSGATPSWQLPELDLLLASAGK